MTEVAPGIHRIESILGPRPFSQYLLRGERTLLVDTGVKETPADVILPFLDGAGIDPAELDLVLLSHADVDHFGAGKATACHGRDEHWLGAGGAHAADHPAHVFRERGLRIGVAPQVALLLVVVPELDQQDVAAAHLRCEPVEMSFVEVAARAAAVLRAIHDFDIRVEEAAQHFTPTGARPAFLGIAS